MSTEAKAAEADPGLLITESAAQEILRQRDKRGNPGSAIRIGIRGGGCTGFTYLFEWDDSPPKGTDKVFKAFGATVYVDPKSFVYFQGTELDFVRGMMGHGFKFNNPNAKGSCGCGESVQF
ncbi:MAG: iron-sulfur cluster assembly accessory protein [Deltaproteobacteria bacterium]|nr:iron-sulfur cluster assembly accessory protein [Deltaproteobacteria bacterium]